MAASTQKLMLCILDGFAFGEGGEQSAVEQAHTPCLDMLMRTCPHLSLGASGPDVGLPEGQMGNSEVGHLNIGAGRIVYQELSRIDKAIEDKSFFSNEVLSKSCIAVRERQASLHLMGLYSDGGVHSSLKHIQAVIQLACQYGVKDIKLHLFTDGRDVDPRSAYGFIEELLQFIDALRVQQPTKDFRLAIATLSGRYYAMDRDRRYERIEQAYASIVLGSNPSAYTVLDYIEAMYEQGITDEFIVPASFSYEGMNPDDTVIFCNFRPDRARELCHALSSGFAEAPSANLKRVIPHELVCMTQYDESFDLPLAFPKVLLDEVLADVLSSAGISQLHAAETEKYAHVTFFMNGGKEEPKAGEDRLLINSPKVATYDLQPEMSAPQLTQELIADMRARAHQVYLVNYANCDMVGHTGVFSAAQRAVEAVDSCLAQLISVAKEQDVEVLICADHGNVERMYEIKAGEKRPYTAHTTNRVPFIYVGKRRIRFKEGADKWGKLSDIAPSILTLLSLEQPPSWTGKSLFEVELSGDS